MKRSIQERIAIALAALAIPVLVGGCGKKDAGSTTSNNTQPGYYYGPNGSPYINGTGGCIPLSNLMSGQPIGFQINGAYFSGVSLVGGYMPRTGQSVGQVAIGGGGSGGPYSRTGVDGSLSMNIQAGGIAYGSNYPYTNYNNQPYMNYGGYQSPTQATATGVLQISQATLQDMLYQSGGQYANYWGGSQPYGTIPGSFPNNSFYPGPFQQYGYGNGNASQVCVSGLSFDLGVYQQTFYGGYVYVFLNNTSHGYALYF